MLLSRHGSLVICFVRGTSLLFFFFQAEDGIRDIGVTGVQTCALPISRPAHRAGAGPRPGARRRRPGGLGHLPPVGGDPVRPERRAAGRAARRPHRGRGEPGVRRDHALPTPDDTRALGAALAELLRAGDLVVLVGPLGAGKTALTQGMGETLGVREPVTSPTFVISRVHRGGRLTLVHVDAYRLGGVADVDDLDLDASTEESVTVVEWGQGLVEQLADEHLEVRLDRRDDDVRTAVLGPHGPGWGQGPEIGRAPG